MPDATSPPVFSTPQFQKFARAAAVLALAFAFPLWKLFRFAVGDELHSYIPLMPFVSAYLVWTQTEKPPRDSAPARGLALLFFAAGLTALAVYFFLAPAAIENSLALSTLAWLFFLTGAGCWFLGGATMRALAFPFFLLIFMIPFPVVLREGIETALQYGSAEVADWMFALSGMTFWHENMVFRLPGINLEVAPECSGIHSTLVLFITSLVAGRMILRRWRNRALLCLAVIPLALLRNGFRVFVIGELCVHVSPRMIDSPIHHRGGPLFFVLSLAPFFLLLYFLHKTERAGAAAQPPQPTKN
jgi:exosortase C (VPDSG-CTERM-specific)